MNTLHYALIALLGFPCRSDSASPTLISARDGKTMVLIPGGTFRMGSQTGYQEEAPVHSVNVTSFYMDQLPVTNREFKTFCDSTGAPYPPNPRWEEMPDYFLDYPDYPVVNVTLEQASAYASWAGKRIPTEAEWEYAACGGLDQPLYPWGNEVPDGARAKFADRNPGYEWRDVRVATPWKYTAPVGSFAPNRYGLYDMAGNVYQWTTDWFFRYDDTVRDMSHVEDGWGGSRVVRGGCYYSNAFDLRVARRRQQPSGSSFFSIGFRCVRDADAAASATAKAAPAQQQNAPSTAWREKLNVPRIPTPPGLRLCLGEYNEITAEQARHFRNAGFSSVEFYLTWESVENKGENQWDFSAWDKQVEILRRAGLKWTAFIIAGPAYSLPDWYRKSKDFVGLRCLEHNIESKTNTLWDPAFYRYVDRFLARVAEHYGGTGTLEGVLLGISGDFGEAIFPVWHGGWPPTIAGLYHSHEGYWCNDPYARTAFIEQMKGHFNGDLAALNASWGTSFKSFASVTMPPLKVDYVEGFRIDELTPKGEFTMRTARDRRRWVDFIDWYRASMTRHADEWMRLGRKHFPGIPVYLCTGGDADPAHGSDFADQCKVAAKYHGGIRITNETTDFGLNFTCTNWVATASHLYGNQFGFEPAGMVLDRGVVSRIYNAAASGVDEFMSYAGNIYDTEARMDLFLKYAPLIRTTTPMKEGALLYPDLDLVMGNTDFFKGLVPFVSMFRDYSDILFADDRLIGDGVLHQIAWMMVFDARWFRKSSLEKIVTWVENGGLLIAANTDSLCSLEDGDNFFPRLFNVDGGEKRVGNGATFHIPGRLHAVREVTPVRALKPGEKPAEGSCEQYQSVLFDATTRFLNKHGRAVPDGKIDRVFTAIVDSTFLILNHTKEKVVRNLFISTGDIRKISLEGNSIQKIAR